MRLMFMDIVMWPGYMLALGIATILDWIKPYDHSNNVGGIVWFVLGVVACNVLFYLGLIVLLLYFIFR